MIDVEWPRGLHVNTADGVIDGFLGMGTEWVVLQCTQSDEATPSARPRQERRETRQEKQERCPATPSA
jgi:hypothetical protein